MARVFRPLLNPARYKGAHGGRGSGKSHFFAEQIVSDCLAQPGTKAVCIREVMKDLKDSSKAVIEAKISQLGVGSQFRVKVNEIETPGGGLIIFRGMQDYTAESIKSLEGFRIAWIEEAQTLSERSLTLLRPTIRVEGSEIWASWNPTRKTDAIDKFLRANKPDGAIIVEANWRDNPWFPQVLEDERRHDQSSYPERYAHIWEGAYATALEGAYYAGCLEQAKIAGRITRLSPDPILKVKAFWDIGGSSRTSDANAIWIAQFIDREIHLLDYIETQGQPLAYIVNELRGRGWDNCTCYLPHDGVNANNVTGKRYQDHLEDAEFPVEVIPNQGAGAARMRIEAARRIFPICYFDEIKTASGRDALGWYHEKRDDARNVGLGPEHDWSSHAADAFGLMAICYERPEQQQDDVVPYRPVPGGGAWLGV